MDRTQLLLLGLPLHRRHSTAPNPSDVGGIGIGNTVNINFCASCSYRGTAVTMKKMLETAFPGIDVVLANYPPSLPKFLLGKVIPVFQIGVIAIVVTGEQIFPMLGFRTPPPWYYYSLRANKFGTFATSWLLRNAAPSFLQSTGAFEVYLNNKLGSEAVEGVVLNLPVLVHLKTEAFALMKNLRLLEIDYVHLTGSYEHLSKELRWLRWRMCPLEFLPLNFHLENVVVLDMQHSNLKQLCKGNKHILNKLKILDLSYSKNLTQSPCFLQVPHLEILIFKGCTSLVELHESIEHLEGLVFLNLNGCKNLRNLPRSISKLKSLQGISLSGCLKLDKLSEQLGNMIAAKELVADITAIKNLKSGSLPECKGPASESWLWSLFSSWISPERWNPISLLRASCFRFYYLGRLTLRNCNLSEDEIPNDLGCLSSLQQLDLSENNFRELPHYINHLPNLKLLLLNGCTSLQSISRLPAKVELLMAQSCSSLEKLSILTGSQLVGLSLINCSKLVEIQGLNLESNFGIELLGCYNLSSDFWTGLLQCPSTRSATCRFSFLPVSEIPNWFNHQRIGSSISFHVPSVSENEIHVLLICAVYAKKKESHQWQTEPRLIFHNKTRGYRQEVSAGELGYLVNESENLLLLQGPLIGNKFRILVSPKKELVIEIESEEEIEVFFELPSMGEVKKCGVHLLVDEPQVIDKNGSALQYVDSYTVIDDKI